MSVLEKLSSLVSSSSLGAPLGICRGKLAGHLGIWGKLSKENHELFRSVVTYQGTTKAGKKISGSFSYTFAPALSGNFYQSVEMPRVFKEFLVGKNPAIDGSVTVDFVGSGGKTSLTFELRPILKCYRMKGAGIPADLNEVSDWRLVDSPELAALKESE